MPPSASSSSTTMSSPACAGSRPPSRKPRPTSAPTPGRPSASSPCPATRPQPPLESYLAIDSNVLAVPAVDTKRSLLGLNANCNGYLCRVKLQWLWDATRRAAEPTVSNSDKRKAEQADE